MISNRNFSLYGWLWDDSKNIGMRFTNNDGLYIDMTWEQLAALTDHCSDIERLKDKFFDNSIPLISFSMRAFKKYRFEYKKNEVTPHKIVIGSIDDIATDSLNIKYGLLTYVITGRAYAKELLQYSSAALYGSGLFEALGGVGAELDVEENEVSYIIYSLKNMQELTQIGLMNIVNNVLGERIKTSASSICYISAQGEENSYSIIELAFRDSLLRYKDQLSLVTLEAQYEENGYLKTYYTKDGLVEQSVASAYSSVTAYKKTVFNNRLNIKNDKLYNSVTRQVIVNSNGLPYNTVLGAWLKVHEFENYKLYQVENKILDLVTVKLGEDIVNSSELTFVKSVRDKMVVYRDYSLCNDGLASNLPKACLAVEALCQDAFKRFLVDIEDFDCYALKHLMTLNVSVKKVNKRVRIYVKMNKSMGEGHSYIEPLYDKLFLGK